MTTKTRCTVTREQLETYRRLDKQRLELDRQSRAVSSELKVLGAAIKEAMEEADQMNVRRGNITAILEEKRLSPRWKDELRNLVGEEKVIEIQNSAGTTRRLAVTEA